MWWAVFRKYENGILTTGMGGGTGAEPPVIAKACRDAGLLTIAVVTIPFKSEEDKDKIYHRQYQ